jgi:uncharacterized protein (TIGR03437 family)
MRVKAQTDAPVVWWDTGMVKLRKPNTGSNSDPIPADAGSRGTVTLSAARNEFEPFQVFVAAQSAPVTQVDITITDLADGKGNIIAASQPDGKPRNVVIYREHYLNVVSKSNDISSLGLTPDALVPKIDEYYGEVRRMPGESTPAFPFGVAANTKQGIWIDVYVPAGTPAGLYIGSVNVTISGSLYTRLPIQLAVRDFELPSTPSLHSAYAVGTSEMTLGHFHQPISGLSKETGTTLLCLYTKELLLHRLSNELAIWPSPRWTGSGIDWTIPAASLASQCKERYPDFLNGASKLPSGKLPGTKLTTVRFREDKVWTGTTLNFAAQQYGSLANYKTYLNQYSDRFKQNGWQSQLFYYMYDEPVFRPINGVWRCDIEWNGSPSSDWRTLYDKSKWFKDNGIDVPVLVTTNRPSAEQCIPNYIGDPNWARYIDIFTVGNRQLDGKPSGINSSEDPTGPPFNQNLRGAYDEIVTPPAKQLWWYHACGNHDCGGTGENEYIAPMADLPNIYSRMFEWLTFRYQVGYSAPGPDAELYYETVYAYQNWDGAVNSPSDPWNKIYYFTGNGDGTFFYPGRPNTIGGTSHIPIPSIRLKMVREGIEDFEYLKLAESEKNRGGVNGKRWVYDNILLPYLGDVDPRDNTTKFITYVWNKNPGNAASATGLLRAREALARVIRNDSTSVDAASLNRVAAPGQILIASGTGFPSGATANLEATSTPLPTKLGNVSVRVNGILSPLYSVNVGGSIGSGAFQIHYQLPYEVQPGLAFVEIFSGETWVTSELLTVSASAPGVFTLSSNGLGQAVALNQNFTLNGDANQNPYAKPAFRGQTIVIFATGEGGQFVDAATRRPLTLASGADTPTGGNPLYVTVADPNVTIGGVNATVTFSGPVFVGLWQINVVIPTNAPTGGNVPMVITSGGQTSNITTIALN